MAIVNDEKSKVLIPNGDDIKLKSFRSSDGLWLMKKIGKMEEKAYRNVFPKIASMNLEFKTLKLPIPDDYKLAKIIAQDDLGGLVAELEPNILFIKKYEGARFDDRWNESVQVPTFGGRGIPSIFATKIVDILEDFSKISLESFLDYGLSRFDMKVWQLNKLPERMRNLVPDQITSQEIQKFQEILISRLTIRPKEIITNGDFYPRNLIEMENGKIVVFDWESSDMRTSLINTTESHLAFMFIHMWGNRDFQRLLVKDGVQRLGLNLEELQLAILMR